MTTNLFKMKMSSTSPLLAHCGVEGQGSAQPPHLVHHGGVEPPEGLRRQGDEGEALLATELPGAGHLPGVGLVHGKPRGGGRPRPGGVLEGVGDGDVQGGVQGAGPAGDEAGVSILLLYSLFRRAPY